MIQVLGQKAIKQERAERGRVSGSHPAGGKAKKEILVLPDGLSVALQRSPKRRTELKLAVVHTGSRQVSPGRYELADRSLVGGLYDGPELWEDVGDVIERKYGWENVSGVTPGYREVWDGIRSHDPPVASSALAGAELRAEAKSRLLVRALRGYIFDNWEGLRGLGYEEGPQRVGGVEGNIDKNLANRFKKRGMAWSENGAHRLSKLVLKHKGGELVAWLEKHCAWQGFAGKVGEVTRSVQEGISDPEAWLFASLPALDTSQSISRFLRALAHPRWITRNVS